MDISTNRLTPPKLAEISGAGHPIVKFQQPSETHSDIEFPKHYARRLNDLSDFFGKEFENHGMSQ